MPNEDTATPETKTHCDVRADHPTTRRASQKLDAYCRELESARRPRPPRWRCNAHHLVRSEPKTPRRERVVFLSGFTQVLGCDHGHSGRM